MVENKNYMHIISIPSTPPSITVIQIQWLNYDNTVLKTMSFVSPISESKIKKHAPPNPTYDDANYQYTFTGWTRTVTSNTIFNYIAQYTKTAKTKWKKYNSESYTKYAWNQYNNTTGEIKTEFNYNQAVTSIEFNDYWHSNRNNCYCYYSTAGYTASNGTFTLKSYKSLRAVDCDPNTGTGKVSISQFTSKSGISIFYTIGSALYSNINGTKQAVIGSVYNGTMITYINVNKSSGYTVKFGDTKGSFRTTLYTDSASSYTANVKNSDGYWYDGGTLTTLYRCGTYITDITSSNSSAYPANGRHADGYWYIKQ